MLLNCGVGEDSWVSFGLQGVPTSTFWKRSALGFLWKEWCYSWHSSTLATSCEELTHWKSLWCWEGLGAGREGDDRGWDGWMASLTQWTWVWVNSRSWWWTERPGVLQFMGSHRVGRNWVTELNWILFSQERKKKNIWALNYKTYILPSEKKSIWKDYKMASCMISVYNFLEEIAKYVVARNLGVKAGRMNRLSTGEF